MSPGPCRLPAHAAARAEVRARCPPRVVPGQPRGSRGQGSRARKIWIARSSGWLLFSFFPSNCSPTNLSVTVSTVPRGGGGEGGWEVGTAGTGRIGAVPQGRSLSGVGSRPGVHGAKRGTAWSPWAAPLWGRPLCTAWDAPDLIPAPLNRGASPPCHPWARSRRDFPPFTFQRIWGPESFRHQAHGVRSQHLWARLAQSPKCHHLFGTGHLLVQSITWQLGTCPELTLGFWPLRV